MSIVGCGIDPGELSAVFYRRTINSNPVVRASYGSELAVPKFCSLSRVCVRNEECFDGETWLHAPSHCFLR